MMLSFEPGACDAARRVIELKLKGQLAGPIDPQQSVTAALVDGLEVIGGVAWENWHPIWRTVEATVATIYPARWTPRAMRAIAEIPFLRWNCLTLAMRSSIGNTRVASILPRLGFERHSIPYIRAGEPDVIYVLTREAWIKHGLPSKEMKALFENDKTRYKKADVRQTFPPANADTAKAARQVWSA